MKVFLKNRSGTINAEGDYTPETKQLVVKKGSIVSKNVNNSEKFYGRKSIEKNREQYVKDYVVVQDVIFTSPSTAANFVTGWSSNGMILWKDEEGNPIKRL